MDQQAENRRDARLRKRLLDVLYLARSSPTGGMGGRSLVDTVSSFVSEDQAFTDDDHALGLLSDLAAKGLVEKTDTRTHKRQRFGLEWMSYRITAAGVDLKQENVPPVPGVDDDRIEE